MSPAAADLVPGYEAGSWFGIGAPKATASSVIETLNVAVNAAFGNATIRARFCGPWRIRNAGFIGQLRKVHNGGN
jgi:hypothetical protein